MLSAMSRLSIVFSAAIALTLCLSGAHAESAQDIVAKADTVRNPEKPFRGTTTLTEYKSSQPVNRNVLLIFSKIDPSSRQFFNLVRYIDPPRDGGKMVL